MLRKLRLDQKSRYERAIATHYLAEMVVGFIDSREHARRIGREQGGIEHWDDIVIEHHDGVFEHVQIKRQDTDFDDTNPVTRGRISRGERRGELQDLSPLDKAIKGLTNHFHPPDGTVTGPARKFTLAIPHNQLDIKKDLPIRHLIALCIECRVQGTTAAGLALRADQPTLHLFEWLTSWCNFTNWDHILPALSKLKIRLFGNENDLEEGINQILEPHFNTPGEVRAAIMHFIDDHTSDIAETIPRLLLSHLRSYCRADRPTWTQYRYDPTAPKWTVAGIHGQNVSDIEPPTSVVPALWAPSGQDRKLKVAATWPTQVNRLSLSAALTRFALHLPSASQALIHRVDAWRTGAILSLAGTLGMEDDGLRDLPWAEDTAPLNPSDSREIIGVRGERDEAAQLVSEMDEVTWARVCDELVTKIGGIEDAELLGAVERIWTSWKDEFSHDAQQRGELLVKMLHPVAEGDEVMGTLRVGPRAVGLLADGLFMLLIVAVGLGEDSATWKSLGNVGAVRTIALRRWGGPEGQRRWPRDLDEDGDALLGKEVADVVILSGVKASPGDIEKANFAENVSDYDSLAKPRTPKLLVTNSIHLRQKLRGATLASLRAYFDEELQRRIVARENNINRPAGGEIHVN